MAAEDAKGAPVAGDVPTVLIVTRTKDRPLLLRRAIADVLSQTFDEWHLVLINDGGDPSPVDRIVSEAGERLAGRITVIHHESSLGMEAASNRGIATRPSRYVVIHDDDDTWDPEFLRRTTSYLREHPDVAGVAVKAVIVWERISGEEIVEIGREDHEPGLRDLLLTDLLRTNRFVPISFLYRREVHDVVGGFRSDLQVVGDWEFHLRVLSHFTVGYLPDERLAFWHQRPDTRGVLGNSVIDRRDEHRHFDDVLRDEYFRAYVRENGLGLPLYLTGYIDRRLRETEAIVTDAVSRELARRNSELHERLDAVEQTVIEHGFIASIKRLPAGVFRRVTGPRKS